MRYRFLFVLLLGSYSYALQAKSPIATIKSTEQCNYYGGVLPGLIYTSKPDSKTEAMFAKIIAYTGLRRNFTILKSNVSNATALTSGGNRYLLYNPDFMKSIRQKSHTYWATVSIMAHEIGHHLQGHTLDGTGSRPEKEIEADEYSGFLLQKMGATLAEALSAMNTFDDVGSSTHPSKELRMSAIQMGWKRSLELNSQS